MAIDPLPTPGLGTFRLKGTDAQQAVRSALELGYRHIDTAQMYENEADVGQAIKDSGIGRDRIFLTTKIWWDRLRPDDLQASMRESLDRLQTPHVDLALIHWPSPDNSVPMADYLEALQAVQDAGQARFIGVSNFTNRQLDQALDILGDQHLLTNQVEVHPFLQNDVVVDHCQERGLTVTGYMPLAVGQVMNDATLQRIADKHGVNPAQVTLAWLHHRGVVPIPSSTNREHLKANLDALRLNLDEDDLTEISALDRNDRIADPDFAPDWD
ncbi:2,5-didehydrogluconate reductase DkgB [Marinobacteraceae bacterium S3BR75-40.1]